MDPIKELALSLANVQRELGDESPEKVVERAVAYEAFLRGSDSKP